MYQIMAYFEKMNTSALYRSLLSACHDKPFNGTQAATADQDLIKYAESETLILVSVYENGYLLHKDLESVTYIGCFYCDVTCGLISEDGQWVVMGGDHLLCIWDQGVLSEIEMRGVFDIRQTGVETIHILIDPWYNNPDTAIWEFNIKTRETKMIRPFTPFKGFNGLIKITW